MHAFRGTGVALVTPFQNNGSIDYPALEKVIDHVITRGVNYLVALGTTAETPTLSEDEKKDVLAFIIEKCNERVPVVCGIGGNNTAEVVHQLNTYKLDEVSAILTVAPYYNKPTQEGLYQHFKAIAMATTKPIILYNVPGRTSSNIAPATALRLANEFKHIIAIKEASGSLPQNMEIIQNKPDHLAVLSGDDNLVLPQIAAGVEGVISVAANCFTKDFTTMVDLCLKGDFAAARKLHYKMLPGIDLLFIEGNPAGVKCTLNHMGLCQNELRLPIVPVSEATAQKIAHYIKGV